MRKPIISGQFYPSDKDELTNAIEGLISKDKEKFAKENVIGAIVPHAGYIFSGKAAVNTIRRISSSVKTFIILGVNHSGLGMNTITKQDFKTPLGIAKINEELFERLKEKCNLEENDEAHVFEHSIEAILPIIQQFFKEFDFVPIIVTENTKELGKSIQKTVSKYEQKTSKKVCVIASSDMTHYGPDYEYVPFVENIKRQMYKLDKGAIDFILKKDVMSFLEYIKKTKATICGKNTISTLLYCLDEISCKAKLIDYYTSSDITGDYSNAVGYAGIIFTKDWVKKQIIYSKIYSRNQSKNKL